MFEKKNNIKEVRKLDNYYSLDNNYNKTDLWKKKELLPFSCIQRKLPINIKIIDGEINSNNTNNNSNNNNLSIQPKKKPNNNYFNMKELENYKPSYIKKNNTNEKKEIKDPIVTFHKKEEKNEEKKEEKKEEEKEEPQFLIDNTKDELNWLEEESPGDNQRNNNFKTEIKSNRRPFGSFKF